jgi:hypothetical protein
MTKRIVFDKLTRDWTMLLDDRPVGSRATPQEARRELDRLAYETLRRAA